MRFFRYSRAVLRLKDVTSLFGIGRFRYDIVKFNKLQNETGFKLKESNFHVLCLRYCF